MGTDAGRENDQKDKSGSFLSLGLKEQMSS